MALCHIVKDHVKCGIRFFFFFCCFTEVIYKGLTEDTALRNYLNNSARKDFFLKNQENGQE